MADLAELLAGARDAGGTRVDVKTPQELANITPYDFQTIFRDQLGDPIVTDWTTTYWNVGSDLELNDQQKVLIKEGPLLVQ